MTALTGENTHNDAECIKLFTETLTRLNEINEAQMTAILKIAIAGAETARSPGNSGTDADALIEKVSGLIGEMKSKSESIAGEIGGASAHGEPGKGDTFCANVEHSIGLALQNSVSSQQQLYIMGMSVLAEAAKMILDSDLPREQ